MKLTRRDLVWIIPSGVSAGFFAWLAWRAVYIQFLKKGVSEPVWKQGARVRVSSVEGLEAPWKFRYFEYPITQGSLYAVIIRVPGPVAGGISVGDTHFLALSRICTHLGCTVNFVDNPEVGAIAYNFRFDNPFLGCPCHFGAFDPMQAGKAIYGPPRYPLPRIQLEEEQGVLYATGHEIPLRPIEQG